jgi:hypothetical protein
MCTLVTNRDVMQRESASVLDMASKPVPVLTGSVTGTLVLELTDAINELAAHRTLHDDLAAWFTLHPTLSEQFGAFQAEQTAKRAAPRKPKRVR